MKSKEIFQLAVRLLGLVMLYHAMQHFIIAAPSMIGFATSTAWLLVIIGLRLGMAYWLISGAPFLMRLAYPEPDQPAPAARPASSEA